MSRKTYQLTCLSEALSPITHMMRSEGNEALVAREPLMTPNGVRHVPFLSGNAIRHRMLREPLADHLVGVIGAGGRLTLQQLNFLYHGGNLTEGGGRENTQQIADVQALFPMIRLLGGSLPSQILAGSVQVWRGTMVCLENASALRAQLPAKYEVPHGLRPAEWFVEGYQYTRGDAIKTHRDLVGDVPEEPSSNLMIFAGQQVIRHAFFLHGFTLPDVSLVEFGALCYGLQRWQNAGGTIGGQASRGHGRLALSILDTNDASKIGDAINAYTTHVENNAETCRKWLDDVFRKKEPKPEKPAKEAKTKKGKKPEEPAPVGGEGGLFNG